MAITRLTAKLIEQAKPPEKGRLEYWDTSVTGLGLRITERGFKSWVIMYRIGGRLRRMTLGPYPRLSLAEARDQARINLANVIKGNDPAEDKKTARKTKETVSSAVAEFVERYAKRNRTWPETQRIFDRMVLPRWGNRPLSEITRTDVNLLLDEIVDGGASYQANRTLAAIRRFFNWSVERDKIVISPAANVRAQGTEVARDRVLSDDEIIKVWNSWSQLSRPFGNAFKLMLVTAQRRSEVAGLGWADVDLPKRLWTLPRQMTKNDRLHEIPLSKLAISLLSEMPKIGPYIFTSGGDRPISGFSKAKARSEVLSEVGDWRIHDLRRTAASGMAQLEIAPHVVEKILNHTSGTISGVAAVYNRYSYLTEKGHALDCWAERLQQLITPATDR